MLFFGPQQVSGFLDAQNAPAAMRSRGGTGASADEKKQPQNAAEQARTMMRSTTGALALPGC